jgi:hypothetical protein
MQHLEYNNENGVFLRGSWCDILRKEWSPVEFCTGGCEEGTWGREAEESKQTKKQTNKQTNKQTPWS